MKKCIKCSATKPKDDFHKDARRPDGLFPYCRECRGIKRKSKRKLKIPHSNGYVLVYLPDHPLSQSSGYIYEHRLVYHMINSGKVNKCEKCGAYWNFRTYRDHVDHIDKNKSNNDISNLRALCNSCNVQRTKKIMHEAKRAIKVTYGGVSMTPTEWSRKDYVNVCGSTIARRKRMGMSDFDALFSGKITHNGNN